MSKKMALVLLVPIMAACGDRQAGRQETGGAQEAASAAAKTEAAAVAGPVKINVKLKKVGSSCVPEDPGRTTVQPGQKVRWKFKNQCQQGKKKEKIDPKNAPISGDCRNVTEVGDAQEEEGRDCTVDPNAPTGTYKYKIDGDAVLDPELDIPPPPPPPKAEPTPGAK